MLARTRGISLRIASAKSGLYEERTLQESARPPETCPQPIRRSPLAVILHFHLGFERLSGRILVIDLKWHSDQLNIFGPLRKLCREDVAFGNQHLLERLKMVTGRNARLNPYNRSGGDSGDGLEAEVSKSPLDASDLNVKRVGVPGVPQPECTGGRAGGS